MKVLVTGGFGNVGGYVVDALIRKGYDVTIFDQQRPKVVNRSVGICLGDLLDPESVAGAVEGQNAVVHMAALIPPMSEENVELSHSVNVTGTLNLIDAMKRSASARRLLFASTTAVHGSRPGRPVPITVDEPFDPPDHYAQQKVLAEEHIRNSGLDWTILRLPAVPTVKPPRRGTGGGLLLLRIPADGHIEVLHPDDAGLAFANAVDCAEAVNRAFLLGGGHSNGCQLTGYEFATGMTSAFGIGRLPKRIFGSDPGGAHAEWLDTTDSQRLFDYQHHTFKQLTDEIRRNIGLRYYLIRAISPFVRFMIIRRSSHQ